MTAKRGRLDSNPTPSASIRSGFLFAKPVRSMAERQILFDAINVGWPEDTGFSQRPSPFRTFALEQMAPAGASEQHFAGAGYLETFGH